MHVLVISQQFPPASSPRAIRWGAVVEPWVRAGDRVDVICGAQAVPSTDSEMEGLRIFSTGGQVVDRWRNRLLRQARSSDREMARPETSQSLLRRRTTYGRFARSVVWVKNHTWKHLHWPDSACMWALAACRQASRLVAGNRYDAMITVSNPYSCHLVGLHVRRRCSELPWLVDLGDPFSELTSEPTNNLRLYSKANRRLESRVLDAADEVSVTTQETAVSYANAFPTVAEKIHVIPPVLALPPQPNSVQADVGTSEHQQSRKLIFAGSLYRTIRNPGPLLHLFSRVLEQPQTRDLELHFYGRVDDCRDVFHSFRDLLGRKVVIHGPVDREVVWQQMHTAHALVNIGNATRTQLPSKVLEYAATGRPILNVVQHNQDTSQAWFEGYQSVFHVHPQHALDDQSQLSAVADFLNAAPRVDSDQVHRFLAPYQVDNIAQAYRRLLPETCQIARAA